MNSKDLEQTLVLIKPDALKNSLTGYVLSFLSEYHTGLRFAGAKIVHVSHMLAEEHYGEHRGKIFYPSLIDYIRGAIHNPNAPEKRRVIAFVYQGPDAIQKVRHIAGPTNPNEAREKRPGCIRALGAVIQLKDPDGKLIGERMDNLIHASANEIDAEREIKLWFRPVDIPPPMRSYPTKMCEEQFYFKANRLYTTHVPESVCLLAAGDIVWATDLEALHALKKGLPAVCSLQSVAAKYLINENRESD